MNTPLYVPRVDAALIGIDALDLEINPVFYAALQQALPLSLIIPS